MKKRATTHTRGLTITELLAVILIIGLMVFLASPTFLKFGTNVRARSAAHHVASILRLAQAQATATNVAHRAWIYTRSDDPPNHIFTTSGGGSSTTQSDKVWTAPQGVEIPDVSSDAEPIKITFTPLGTASAVDSLNNSAGTSVHLIIKGTQVNGNPYDPTGAYTGLGKDERVKCYTVTVNTTNGRTEIYEYGRNSPWASTDL